MNKINLHLPCLILMCFLSVISCNGSYAEETEWVGTEEPVQAPAQNSLAVALELMKVARSTDQFTQLFPIMTQAMTEILMRSNPDKQQAVNELIEKVYTPAIIAHLGELQNQIAVVYARNFSASEMQQMIAFYKSPIGQKYLDTSPKIINETIPIAKVWAQSVAQEATKKLLEQAKKNNLQVPKGMGL